MQKVIWVIGAPRSGTTFITNHIGTKTDYCFNEPWDKYPLGQHKEWKLPENGVIVFKYCGNCFHYNELKNLYPNSKWIHIIRNPIHALYSMIFPKKDAFPERMFFEMGEGEKRMINCFEKWRTTIEECLKIQECKILRYENINFESLSEFIEINLDKPKFKNQNYNFEKEKMEILKKFLENKKINSFALKKIY